MRPSPARRHAAHRSLTAVAVGETVTVHHVLFDLVRAHWAAAGLVAGATVRVTGVTTECVRVHGRRGAVTIDRTLAEFVGVVPDVLQTELALVNG